MEQERQTEDANRTVDDARLDAASSRRVDALIATYEAALSVASHLDLGAVLQRIADRAREIVPAKYSALGVADANGKIIEFYTSGITAEERELLGPIPEGHGLLGELVRTAEPLLVPDLRAHPKSVGFPEHHPPMKTLLGVPILLGNRVLGNLYMTERYGDRPFDEQDLEIVQVLAAHAASAIERAQLHRQVELARASAIEQRDQFRVLVDHLPSGVLIQKPPDGRVELANEAALRLLLGESALRGIVPRYGVDFRLVDEDGQLLPADQRPDLRALNGIPTRNRQLLLERADGSRVALLCQAAPLRNTDGEVSRAVSVYQDVTQLRAAEQIKDDFLSLVSHEFRTPLTAILGGARLLMNEGDRIDPGLRAELLTDVATESDRLDRMLTNMLSLAAIMAGRLSPDTEPVLLGPFLRRVVAEVARQAPDRAFPIELTPDLPPAECDPELLMQVMRNLYENAIKYAPDGEIIRTSVEQRDNTLVLRVTDDGAGIAPEHVSGVFERFRRPGADPTVRGMGLGLYLSRHLVEVQGGSIWAESGGPGQGATFSIELPIARE
ncbi:MAG: GAF domain-containing protein [Thermomicrobiales bacterium]|nr:GAF domain-containing protein [Thermomicrobiales bacterium]